MRCRGQTSRRGAVPVAVHLNHTCEIDAREGPRFSRKLKRSTNDGFRIAVPPRWPTGPSLLNPSKFHQPALYPPRGRSTPHSCKNPARAITPLVNLPSGPSSPPLHDPHQPDQTRHPEPRSQTATPTPARASKTAGQYQAQAIDSIERRLRSLLGLTGAVVKFVRPAPRTQTGPLETDEPAVLKKKTPPEGVPESA